MAPLLIIAALGILCIAALFAVYFLVKIKGDNHD
jgi:hypothetical protein